MWSLSRPWARGSPCSNACVVGTGKIEEEHRGVQSWKYLWNVIWHPMLDACEKKGDTHMYVLPCMFLCLALPSPHVFSVLASHWIISCSGYPQTTLFFFSLLFLSIFHNLCKVQLMLAFAMPWFSKNLIMWGTRKQGDFIQHHMWQSNATADQLQEVLMATVKIG